LITVSNLTKYYGRKPALEDLNFSIENNGAIGLLGLNGAGKTTFMSILAGIICPSDGSVTIGGYDVVQRPREAKRLIGYMPERPAFYDDMRVNEYINFICDVKSIKDNRKAHLDDICDRTGIAHVFKRIIRNLSKGYLQRVGFAAALIGNPRVLLLDEPTAGLDPAQAEQMRAQVKSLSRQCVVIISSHLLSEIQQMCDRVIILSNGKIAADLSRDDMGRIGGSAVEFTIRVKGEIMDIHNALTDAGITAKPLRQAEPGTWDFTIGRGVEKYGDMREDVFRALAAANMPLLQTLNSDNSLEQIFFNVIRQNSDEHPHWR